MTCFQTLQRMTRRRLPAVPLARIRRQVSDFQKDTKGLAAIEFALLGPVIVFGLLMMVDVGTAVRDRMALDYIVRAGATTAAQDVGSDAVLAALNAASTGSMTRNASASALSVGVVQECGCPEAPSTVVACSTTCAGPSPTFIFYALRAETVSAGLLLPAMSLVSEARVQVR